MRFPVLGLQELHFETHREAALFIWQLSIKSSWGMDVHLSLVAALILGSCKLLLGFPAVGLNLINLSEVQIAPYAQMERLPL